MLLDKSGLELRAGEGHCSVWVAGGWVDPYMLMGRIELGLRESEEKNPWENLLNWKEREETTGRVNRKAAARWIYW